MMLMMTRRPMYGVVQMVSIARKAETRANRLIGRAQLSKRTIHGAFAKLETRFAAKTEVRIESGRWVQIRVGSVLYEHAHQVVDQVELIGSLAQVDELHTVVEQIVRRRRIVLVVLQAAVVRIVEIVAHQVDDQILDEFVLLELTRRAEIVGMQDPVGHQVLDQLRVDHVLCDRGGISARVVLLERVQILLEVTQKLEEFGGLVEFAAQVGHIEDFDVFAHEAFAVVRFQALGGVGVCGGVGWCGTGGVSGCRGNLGAVVISQRVFCEISR